MMRPPTNPDFYQTLVLHSSDVVSVVDQEGKFIYVGGAMESLYGFKPEELLGKSMLQFVHPDDLNLAHAALDTIINSKKEKAYPFRYKSRNDQWLWTQISGSNLSQNPTIQGLVVMWRNVSDIVEAKQQLEDSQAHYETLFFSHPDAAFYLSPDGFFKKINNGFTAVTGYDTEVINTHIVQMVSPAFVHGAAQAFEQAISGKASSLECEITSKTGDVLCLSITLMPVMTNGKLIGIQGVGKDVTQVKKATRKIEKQEEKLSSVFESIAQPFAVLNKEWRYSFVNKIFASDLGKDPEYFLGKCVWELFPEAVGSRFYRECHHVAQTGEPAQFDEYVPTFGVTLKYNIYPFPSGVIVSLSDVTKQKVVEQELQKLSLVASKTTNGVVLMDAAGKIEWVNEGFTKLTGYTIEEAIGRVPSELLQGPESDADTEKRIRNSYRQAIPFSEEVLNYKKNGEPFWMHFELTPIFDEAGKLTNFISIETDVTELKKKEEETSVMANDLFAHNRDLQQFTYIVSHNLRTPVANILGLVGLLHNADKNSEHFNFTLSLLSISAEQLDAVIRDLNNILSIRNYGQTGAEDIVYLRPIIESVIESLHENLVSCGATIEVSVPKELQLKAIKPFVYSIFHNLLSNSIKYRSPDRLLHISITLEHNEDSTEIYFTDNGIGIDLNKADKKLFMLYKRFHSHVDGRGVGLYMVKQQALAMGWSIDVDSTPDKGTTFKLLIGSKSTSVK